MVEDDGVQEGGDGVEDADVEPVGEEEEDKVDVGEESLDGEEKFSVFLGRALGLCCLGSSEHFLRSRRCHLWFIGEPCTKKCCT